MKEAAHEVNTGVCERSVVAMNQRRGYDALIDSGESLTLDRLRRKGIVSHKFKVWIVLGIHRVNDTREVL